MSDLKDAYDSIAEDGGSVMITLEGDSVVNPVTESVIPGDDISISTFGVQKNFKLADIDGSIVQYGDCELIVPAYGLESLSVKNNKNKLTIVFNSETWKVIGIRPLAPYALDILYYFHLRK